MNDVTNGILHFIRTWGRDLCSEIPVAYSGGKDSFNLVRGLQFTGYKPLLVSIDMEYSPTFGSNIAASSSSLGLKPTLINPRQMPPTQVSLQTKARLRAFLSLLEKTGSVATDTFTPCTACYNSKVISLGLHLAQSGANTVAFGHHATDAVVSYLKSFIMYYDRWVEGNLQFSLSRFARVAKQILYDVEQSSTLSDSASVRLMLSLSREGKIGTDEPPVQTTEIDEHTLRIVRPLYFVPEATLLEASLNVKHLLNSSDCGHSLSGGSPTARDLTKELFFAEYKTKKRMRQFHRLVHDDITSRLQSDGMQATSVRQQRSDLLGPSYKANHGVAMKL